MKINKVIIYETPKETHGHSHSNPQTPRGAVRPCDLSISEKLDFFRFGIINWENEADKPIEVNLLKKYEPLIKIDEMK